MSLKNKFPMANPSNSNSTASLVAQSALYKIYSEGDIDINSEMDNTELYTNLDQDIHKQQLSSERSGSGSSGSNKSKTSPLAVKIYRFVTSVAILALLGNGYFNLLKFIDNGHHLESASLPNIQDFRLLYVFSDLLVAQAHVSKAWLDWINNAVFGVLLGTIDVLFFDPLFQSVITIPKRSTYESATVIRSLVAIIGIAYGLKKLEWESPLQASLLWSLLNPCVWILLDGTLYGFIVDSFVSIVFASIAYHYDAGLFVEDDLMQVLVRLLWVGSASFFALLVFGKVGRYLFE